MGLYRGLRRLAKLVICPKIVTRWLDRRVHAPSRDSPIKSANDGVF
jgi:hypothetical protein